MDRAELHRYVASEAQAVFPDGMYEACCAEIPRCGLMLVSRFTVRHLAERIGGLGAAADLRRYIETDAGREERILIAWAFLRVADAVGPESAGLCLPLRIAPERLLHMDGLHLCQVGFWLHLMVWPESYCPSRHDEACGKCRLEPPR